MFSTKNLIAILVAAHGIGFLLWFMPSWIPGFKATGSDPHSILSDTVTITHPVGKVFGLVSLALVAGFLVSAWGIFSQATWFCCSSPSYPQLETG